MGRGVHVPPLTHPLRSLNHLCGSIIPNLHIVARLHRGATHIPHPLRAACLHDLPSDKRYAADQKGAAGELTAHAFEADPRNEDMLIAIRDGLSHRLVFQWRPAAKVSALDAGFLLGDGVWEGIRVHKGCLLFVWVRLPHPACMRCRAEAGVCRRLL